MKVTTFHEEHYVASDADLNAHLAKRSPAGTNCCWMCPDANDFPLLNFLVAGDRASLYFFPKEGHPGFSPFADRIMLDPEGITTFDIGGDDIDVRNEFVLSVPRACEVATEFFHTELLPKCVEWFEL